MTFQAGHALLIGVGSYRHHPELNVDVTVADAEAVERVLRDSAFCGYPEGQVARLSHGAAGREGIERALADLAGRVDAGSTVFLFLCSHGAFGSDGRWYFNPHDVRYENDQVVPESGIGEARLIELLRAIPAERLFVIFNTCFSGSVSPTLAGGSGQPLPASSPTPEGVEALLATGRGRIILTAAGEEQYSYFTHGAPLTIFTDALVDGLRGEGVPDRNGFVSAFDLYTHVFDAVTGEVRRRYNETQEPELTVLKGKGPFAVSLFRGAAAALGDIAPGGEMPERRRVRPVDEAQIGRAITNILGENARQLFVDGELQIEGDFVMGDKDKVEGNQMKAEGDINVDTSGGAYFAGNIQMNGGEIIGRDKIVHGDDVHGDKVGGDKISVGNIENAQGVAIGRGAQARADIRQGAGSAEIARLFETLREEVADGPEVADPAAVEQKIAALESEVKKGERADDEQVAGLLQDLADLAPAAVESLVGLFTSSVMAKLAGGATRFVVGRLQRRGE